MKRINFDLGELHAFVVTAERASFRAAAELLHLSQPALSRRVERLESALGARLLQRSTRHVELTALGAEFLQEARAALSSLEEAVQRIDDQNHLRRGRVTVACVPSVATHLLPRLLKEYAQALPDVQIHVIDESASQVLEAVARGEADFGLSFTEPPAGMTMPSGSSSIFITSPTIFMSWICALLLIAEVTLTSRSSSVPVLVMVMKPAATSAAMGDWRDHG